MTVKGQHEERCVWKLHLDSAGNAWVCADEKLDYNHTETTTLAKMILAYFWLALNSLN